MKKLFEEIIELNKLNKNATIHMHLSKLMEEAGELANECNKLTGIKRNKLSESREQIVENLSNEAADSIQTIMSICIESGITYEQLETSLNKANSEWKRHYLNQ